MDTTAHALDLLAANRYVVLASADEGGRPWATPVWFAADDLDRILWLSWPGSRHSRLIARRPQIALTVFDSSRPSEDAAAFYAVAHAAECPEPFLDAALALVNRRSQEHGLPAFRREDVTEPARLRLYVAELTEAWVLDQEAPVDQRAPVPLGAAARTSTTPTERTGSWQS
jgi:nitroimidazol reductase NimA-like FMN-containing flavoprotein (pyridoxamine 5'-phosphate oxidase superfamily)